MVMDDRFGDAAGVPHGITPSDWARHRAVMIGLQERDFCVPLPRWIGRLRFFVTGETRLRTLANPELEQLRAQAACLAARARWSEAAIVQRLLHGKHHGPDADSHSSS